jgi:mannose-6-phosphate isomerase
MKMIYKMKNTIQDYAWGSVSAIPELLGYVNRDNKPQAELWMGSHHRGESLLINGDEDISLSKLIKKNKNDILSEKIASVYGDLPFLFKVLAAGSPLSIQVHPDKKQAEEGFARENESSVPLDAFNRNYKDDNHKPEIICALTPFWAMRGFRNSDSIIDNFRTADLPSFRKEVDQFSESGDPEGLKSFFNSIMSLEGDKKNSFIEELVGAAEKIDNDTFHWVLRLYEKYPEDAAIAAPLYLNLVKLEPGEALYLDAGELHAYLDGMGMELMASSDNVLRGGLTPKHIDREELKKILKFTGGDPQILRAETVSDTLSAYSTPSDEFQLSRIDLASGRNFEISEKNAVQILFVSEGDVRFFNDSGDSLSAEKGESIFVPFDAGKWNLSGDAVLYCASIPGDL